MMNNAHRFMVLALFYQVTSGNFIGKENCPENDKAVMFMLRTIIAMIVPLVISSLYNFYKKNGSKKEDPQEKFGTILRSIDERLGKFGELQRRMDQLERKFADPQEQFGALLGSIEELQKKIEGLQSRHEDHQEKFGAILGSIDERLGKIDQLDGKYGTLLGSIGVLQGRMDHLEGKIEDPQKKFGTLLGSIDERLGTIDRLEGKIEDPQQKFGTLLGSIDQHLGKIDHLEGKIEDPQKKFGELLQSIDRHLGTTEELQKKIGKCEQEKAKLQKEIGRRKDQFKSAWKIAKVYPDWRKEEFQAVNVTLDADTAHPALLLSEQGRQVTFQEKCQDVPSSTQRFDSLSCVLGQLGITSKRSFWEVKVEDARSWDLGICRDNVTRKGRVTISPENGFWALRLYEGEYWALTSPETPLPLRQKPHSVGIFLDYEDGEISFYNMTDGSHIFTFPKNTFSGFLRPLFRLWSPESGTLTIV